MQELWSTVYFGTELKHRMAGLQPGQVFSVRARVRLCP